ncbi:PAS domain-containing protein [Cereibacter sphaeroides]|nr:PAS domain-containing protein [Cereibacter sphaeroides]
MAGTSEKPEAEVLRNAVFEAAPHGYLILDPDLTIIDVNQQYLDLTRARREDLVNVAMFEAFPDNPGDPTPMASATCALRWRRRAPRAARTPWRFKSTTSRCAGPGAASRSATGSR